MIPELIGFGLLCLTILLGFLATIRYLVDGQRIQPRDRIMAALGSTVSAPDLDYLLETARTKGEILVDWRRIVRRLIYIKAANSEIGELDLALALFLSEIDRRNKRRDQIDVILVVALALNSVGLAYLYFIFAF